MENKDLINYLKTIRVATAVNIKDVVRQISARKYLDKISENNNKYKKLIADYCRDNGLTEIPYNISLADFMNEMVTYSAEYCEDMVTFIDKENAKDEFEQCLEFIADFENEYIGVPHCIISRFEDLKNMQIGFKTYKNLQELNEKVNAVLEPLAIDKWNNIKFEDILIE